MSKVLVAYFSATGVTKEVAIKISNLLSSDIYEIKPLTPYSKGDLNWLDKNSRSTIEMRDNNFRPEIIDDNAKIENYDTIILGFPIWWYIAPTIVNSFLDKYDFSNKKIILFATSGGSGFGNTTKFLKLSVSQSTEIIEGILINKKPFDDKLKDWTKSLNI